MSFEDTIRQIIREENEKHLQDIKSLLESHGYQEAPRTLSVKEAASILGFGLTKIYDMVNRGDETGFPFIRDGGRIVIPYHALMNWIEQQTNIAI
ncbi:hypothetical protein CHI07_16900 [Paenibacillus sp. 7884-2]|nr:hypothetical protein CHI07_16900 [Paenibacillus sp. 7884-2]